ncbi:hypothetical protein B0A52_03447 [Exophiala mesophila]|uniref:Multiple myeloma tumor-associated protein 2-like N-terminal domain-containing protein n=1 Tax=Exophiala mesophila TaxID=212818 RepID=A0A438N6A9_EXOME|nr:hypothetical protein B0A52_03447 [Exophiala mesophila]
MDLLATVRKEGSRGGRGDFQWSDVQTSSHRENYLGHSLMAPVGRWQKGRDLNWYAKGDGDNKVDGESQEDPAARAARERKEEIRKVKEAEEDALARALGLPVPERNNPNMEQLGTQREVGKLLKEAADGQNPVPSRGVGYGHASTASGAGPVTDRIQGTGNPQDDKELQYALKEYKRRHRDDRRSSRSPSREHHRHRHHGRDREHRSRPRDDDRHEDSHRRRKHRDHRPRASPDGRERRKHRSTSPAPRRDSYRARDGRRSRSPYSRRSHHKDRH